MRLLLFGILIGVLSSAIAVLITQATIAACERRYTQVLYALLKQPKPSTDKELRLLWLAIGKLTDLAVLDGHCAYCGEEHPDLAYDPFNPLFHRQGASPCPVPFSRKLYRDLCKDLFQQRSAGSLFHHGSQPQLPPPSQERSR